MAQQPLTAELLLHAYSVGIFPMSEHRDDPEVFWVDPLHRGVLPLDGFRISKSLKKAIRRPDYRVAVDTAFSDVVRACADRDETWINETIFDLYGQLHDLGAAHSFELWQDDRLVGGAYGVALGGAFFGESMFSARRDASKIVLAYLVDHLRQAGFALLDTQFITPHLESLGAIEIPRDDYRAQLAKALELDTDFGAVPVPDAHSLLQRMTQTS